MTVAKGQVSLHDVQTKTQSSNDTTTCASHCLYSATLTIGTGTPFPRNENLPLQLSIAVSAVSECISYIWTSHTL